MGKYSRHPRLIDDPNFQAIVSDWDSDNTRRIEEITAGSSYLAKWRCRKCGHTWIAAVNQRTLYGKGCRACFENATTGKDDLVSKRPDLLTEWDWDKNTKNPNLLKIGSHYLASWICSNCNAKWPASVKNRVNGSGCPARCAKKGIDDLATLHPELLRDWDFEKNPQDPSCISPYSTLKAFWKCCKCNQEWQAQVYSRVKGNGCSVCSNKTIVAGINDLDTTHPDLAKEWDQEVNEKTSKEYGYGSGYVAHWICSTCGRKWKARISSRSNAGNGCSSCSQFGYKDDKPAVFYLIEHTELRSRKYGITNRGTSRIEHFQSRGWKVHYLLESTNGKVVRLVEDEFEKWLRDTLSVPVFLGTTEMGNRGGWTETFSAEAIAMDKLIQKAEELAKAFTLQVENESV